MKKIIVGLCIVVLIAVFGGRALWLYQHRETDTNVVKIGALVPTSGFMAFEGKNVVSALNLLAEKMNAKRDVKIKVIYEDDKYTSKDSVSAFRKLQSQGVDLYFVYGDLPAKAIVSIAQEQKLPLFAMAESKELNDSPVVVNLSPSSTDWTDSIFSFVNEMLKPQNVVIVHQKDMAHVESTKRLKDKFKDTVQVINSEQFDPNVMEVRPLVSKVLSYKPDVVIVLGYGSTYTAILNTLREQGFTGTIVSDPNVSSIKHELAKTPYPLYWTDTLFDDNTDIPEIKEFLAEFKEKFGKKPSTFTMMSYVGAQALMNAIQTAEYKPMDIYNNIQQTKDLKTVLGPVTIDKNKWMKLPIVIKQLQPDGTAKIVKE
ncbi:MAG: ABC transporter substrate-binding protein [Alphaproteobacteria bacterium]|nr:ABC transporter substrate-binding protein [Alphaproteobacteria bacterium]